jgi:predicted phosphodiesterase
MDLGDLAGPVLIFGGPYSNLAATRAMQATAKSLGIPADQVFCTGDTVAYCAEPNETVAVLRDWGCHALMGNCEEALASEAADCGCGFEAGTRCSTLSVEWYRFAKEQLSPAERDWMGSLPRTLRFRHGGKRFRLVHGSVERINAFVFASDPAEPKQRQLAIAEADAVIGGHCGLPFGERLVNGYWLNAGAIGMPANDGTPDGWFLLLHTVEGRLEASWRRLTYDSRPSRAAMQAARLSLPYADCLETGLWPSLDVLPDAERNQTGRKLSIHSLSIR